MKFLLDENAHHGLIAFLKMLGHEVIACPKSVSNGKVMELAVRNGAVLITHDKDFAIPRYANESPGIILIRIPTQEFDRLKSALKKLLLEKSPQDFKNKVLMLL